MTNEQLALLLNMIATKLQREIKFVNEELGLHPELPGILPTRKMRRYKGDNPFLSYLDPDPDHWQEVDTDDFVVLDGLYNLHRELVDSAETLTGSKTTYPILETR